MKYCYTIGSCLFCLLANKHCWAARGKIIVKQDYSFEIISSGNAHFLCKTLVLSCTKLKEIQFADFGSVFSVTFTAWSQEGPLKRSHTRKFSEIFLKLGQDISCLKSWEEFDRGGCILLSMRKMGILMIVIILALMSRMFDEYNLTAVRLHEILSLSE